MKDLFRIIEIIVTEIYFLVFPFSLPFFFAQWPVFPKQVATKRTADFKGLMVSQVAST